MIVCEVILYPTPTSRGPANRKADHRGRMWFRRVPVQGESIALEDDRGESDWSMDEPDMASRVYMVSEVRWRVAKPEDRNPPPPLVVAQRLS